MFFCRLSKGVSRKFLTINYFQLFPKSSFKMFNRQPFLCGTFYWYCSTKVKFTVIYVNPVINEKLIKVIPAVNFNRPPFRPELSKSCSNLNYSYFFGEYIFQIKRYKMTVAIRDNKTYYVFI